MDKKRKLSPNRASCKQQYKRDWETELKWLKPGKSIYHAKCTVCCSELSISSGGLKDLRRHSNTNTHQKCLRSSEGNLSLSSFVVKEKNDVTDAELLWANFICENNLPISLSDNFTKLVPTMFPDSDVASNFRCGRTKTSAIIQQAIASCEEEKIINSMRTSLFTLLIDESTDITIHRQMIILVRFFTSQQVETQLYKVVAIEGKASGENLFNIVNSSFEEDNISWENCLSMSSDGAKAMVGEFNSVLSRVRGQQENLWFLHCTCHVAHLAASHACGELPTVCEQLARDVYSYFKTSGKRQDDYRQIQKLLDVEEHKILRPCFTRWLAMLQCVNRLLEQWAALTEYFDNIEVKEGALESVQRIKATLHSSSAKLYFLFLQAVLPRFEKFNLLFQQERPYLHKLYSEICVLLRQTIASFIQFSVIQKSDLTSVDLQQQNQLPDNSLFIGHATATFLAENEIPSCEKTEFFNSVRKFYETGTKELYRLLPLQDPVLRNIDIFDPARKQSGEWEKVANLAKTFPNVILDEEHDALNEEFFAYTLWDLSSASDLQLSDPVDIFWYKVSTYEENEKPRFPTLCKLAKAMLILPHSNASVERAFSQLRLIKTAHRSSLQAPMLNALMQVSARKHTGEFKPTPEMRKRAKNLKK